MSTRQSSVPGAGQPLQPESPGRRPDILAKYCQSLLRLVRRGRAATTVEYALILSLVSAVVGAGIFAMNAGVQEYFSAAAAGVSGNGGQGGGGDTNPGGGGSGDEDDDDDEEEPPSDVVFADSFDSSNSRANWRFDNNHWWDIGDGGLQAGPVSGWNEVVSYAKKSDFADGTVALDANVNDGSGFGLFFHLSGDPTKSKPFDGYNFQYDAGEGAFVLRKWIGGVEIYEPLAVATPEESFQWLGTSHRVSVTTEGTLITAKVDGQTVLSANDDSFSSGGVGLRLWNNADATFDNVSVTTPIR